MKTKHSALAHNFTRLVKTEHYDHNNRQDTLHCLISVCKVDGYKNTSSYGKMFLY